MQPKQKVQNRRYAVLYGILGGAFMFTFFRMTFKGDLRRGQPFRSLFFGNAAHWPTFVKGFAPLDLAMACGYMWLIFSLMSVLMSYDKEEPRDVKGWVRFGIGYFVFFGAFGGLIGAVLAGWYTSLEFFLAMGAMMVILATGLCAFGLCVFMVGGAVFLLSKNVWARVHNKRVVQPLVRFGRYMNADDLQEGG